jgi:4-amino-4-deoxy-L-arabinose transferase-like glycosyltransferase
MEEQELPINDDPTILEYLRNLLSGAPSGGVAQVTEAEDIVDEIPGQPKAGKFFLTSLVFFLLGQFLLESFRNTLSIVAVAFFLLGIFLALVSKRQQETDSLSFWTKDVQTQLSEQKFRWTWLLIAVVLAIGAFLVYQDGKMNFASLLLWAGSILAVVGSFWQRSGGREAPDLREYFTRLVADKPRLILAGLALLVVVYFLLMKLDSIPSEMISTQVETFLSVHAIRGGDWGLWFPRNVVSEPLGYYWAALVSTFFGAPLSYLALKAAYALSGLIAVFYTYKLGKLFFDDKTGWIAALLMGVSFWAILQQRAVVGYGLVLALLVPAVYYLFKSLEEDDFNALLVGSVLTCFGIMTNKVFLVLPLVNILVTLTYFTRKNQANRRNAILLRVGLGLIVSVIVLLPYLFVVFSNFKAWAAPITTGFLLPQGSANGILIFLRNLLSGMGIFIWSNQSSWVDGLRNRPALDWVSAAFFLFALILMLILTKKNNRHRLLSMLIGLVLFLVPSAINLAFPAEHPALDKSLPLLLFAILLAARGMSLAYEQFSTLRIATVKAWKYGLIAVILILVVFINYQLITEDYAVQFTNSAWNTREMASAIANFDEGQGGYSQGYIVGYPHWVDARAIAILQGNPDENLSILPENIEQTVETAIPKIFLLNPFDKEGIGKLQSVYPQGLITTYQSANPDKNFVIYIVGQ